MDKKATCIRSNLWMEDHGSIEFELMDYGSGDPKREVNIWDTKKEKYLWKGTPEEFWNLVLAGLEAQKKE